MPEVSIITPAYNCGSTIGETIASVRSQTFGDWEMLIVNDASQDDTLEAIERARGDDPRITVWSFDTNAGAGPARNRAIQAAEGRYMAFLDSDDVWLPRKLAVQLSEMQRRAMAFSYHDYYVIDAEGQRRKRTVSPPRLDYQGYMRNTAIGVLTIMLDTALVGKPEMLALPANEAIVAWLSILRSGVVAERVDGIYACYRVRKGSVSRNKLRAAYWIWHVYRHHEQLSPLAASANLACYAWNAFRKNWGVLRG